MKQKIILIQVLLLCIGICVAAAPVEALIEIDSNDLSAFVDGMVSEQMESDAIAGATVTVVHQGEILLEKGYGLADVTSNQPVTADTLFRVGSITKLFTWISVMQLVEQGAIDLDADISTYITFDFSDRFEDQPITMRHLMSHTAGFEDGTYGLEAADVSSLKSNEEWLNVHLPSRIYPPGETMAYSNYGTALAGHIVEEISGQPFADYVEQEIFQPLGMTQATMRQPVPASLAPSLSKPYSYADLQFVEGPFELFHPVPAGAGSLSGHDMGLFMLAMLAPEHEILKPETVTEMFSTLYRLDPEVNGYAHGWMEYDQGQERMVGHAGDTAFFHSFLVLVPERELGFFVSYNTAHVTLQPYQLADGIINRYLPIDTGFVPDPTINLSPYAGTYRMARHNESSPEKLLQLLTTFKIGVDGDELVLTGFIGEDRFKPVSPTHFHAVEGTQELAFRLDDQGRPEAAMLGNIPITVLEPMRWYETPLFTVMILGLILALYLTTILAAVIDWVQRQISRRPLSSVARWRRVPIYLLIVSTFSLLLGFILPLNGMMDVMTGSVSLYRYIVPLPWIITAITIWVAYAGWQIWSVQDSTMGLLGRWHYGLLMGAALIFLWWMAFWRFFAGIPPT